MQVLSVDLALKHSGPGCISLKIIADSGFGLNLSQFEGIGSGNVRCQVTVHGYELQDGDCAVIWQTVPDETFFLQYMDGGLHQLTQIGDWQLINRAARSGQISYRPSIGEAVYYIGPEMPGYFEAMRLNMTPFEHLKWVQKNELPTNPHLLTHLDREVDVRGMTAQCILDMLLAYRQVCREQETARDLLREVEGMTERLLVKDPKKSALASVFMSVLSEGNQMEKRCAQEAIISLVDLAEKLGVKLDSKSYFTRRGE